MANIQELYRRKLTAVDEAIGQVHNGDYVVVPTAAGEPPALMAELSKRRREYMDVKVSQVLPVHKFDYLDPETSQHIRNLSYFHGSPTRLGGQDGWVDYIPNYFSEIPEMIRRGHIPADVVLAMASPMDKFGYFSVSLGTDYTMAAISKARVLVLEVNPHVPFAYGNCLVHITQATALVESSAPIIEAGQPEIGQVQEDIGKYVAEFIEDGSTLQIGYGGIPDAVVRQLKDKHDLGFHTEMVGDGILTLINCGAVTNKKKNYLPGKGVATFAFGSKSLYEFMDRNPALEMHPADFTNSPFLAGRNDNLVTINASLQVDFLGQCGSESLGVLPYSGTGGQSDFVRAGNYSRGGKSFIVLPSTAKKGTISRIVPTLTPGTAITTSKNDVNYVVTEYGVAQLRGKSYKERTRELISIAHPDFRAELTEAARKMKIL